MSWRDIGAVDLRALVEPRVQLHWAAQVVAAVAMGWLERRDDDSHTNMQWNASLGALVGHPTDAGIAVGLRVVDRTLLEVRDSEVTSEFDVAGRSLSDALAWADGRVARAMRAEARQLALPTYDLPDHPIRRGAPFGAADAALAELARWYDNADALLRSLAAREPCSTPVRCWPHHFDIAAIAYLDRERRVSTGPQIGFGMSPGDSSYAEPYLYLTPYPLAASTVLPELARGHWHRSGWTGAVMTASELLTESDRSRDADVERFMNDALSACQAVVALS